MIIRTSQILVAALAASAAGFVEAQELLDISQSCPLYSEGITEDIYAFRSDQDTEELFRRIADILEAADTELMAANVPSVLAVIHGNKRLVLYNTDYAHPLDPGNDRDLRLTAMLAHAVAHHALGHSLRKHQGWMADEITADRYAGRVLAQIVNDPNRTLGLLQRSMVMPEVGIGPAGSERRQAVLEGWRQIDAELAEQGGAEFQAGNGADTGEEIPRLPWPPPQASARVRLPPIIDSPGGRLSEIAAALESAFYSAGYGDFSYLAVPSGFAMVSQLEQIHPDGTPLPLPDRWSARVRPFRQFSLENYLRALFRATPGHFRILVFIVTPVPFSQSDQAVDAREAEAWLAIGLDALPSEIGNLPITDETKTSVLVYEFVKPTRDDDPKFQSPGLLPAVDHLRRARLWESLGL